MHGVPDSVTEVRSPATKTVTKVPVHGCARVREVWFVDPIEPIVGIDRLQDERYDRPSITELKSLTAISAMAGVVIDWDRFPPWCSQVKRVPFVHVLSTVCALLDPMVHGAPGGW